MQFTSDQRLEDGVLERDFLLGEIPGILWTPQASPSAGLILLGLPGGPGGLPAMRTRLTDRARAAAADGFASLTIELPGGGDRPRLPAVEQARVELRQAVLAGQPIPPDVIDRLVLPLVDQSVPEWQVAIDAALSIDEVAGPIGWSGGLISIPVRLAATDPRIAAAVLFAGTYVPRSIIAEARQITIPIHVLLQWDDEGTDRQVGLELFDAFGSTQKSLYANMGGHTGVPWWAGEEAGRFLARHLRPAEGDASGT